MQRYISSIVTKNMKDQLLEMDYNEITIDKLIELFSEKINSHNRPLFKDFSSEVFFRARKINNVTDKKLERASCIWYPNWSTIKPEYHSYNRCSDKGESFFYASNSLEAAVREMHLENGDRLLIGEFHTDNSNIKIPSQFVGIESLKKTKEFKKLLANYSSNDEHDREIEKWMTSFFTQKILDGEEALYKPCIAFSRILLKNEFIKCLIYPSVASDYKLVNFGIKPDFVDNFMNCQQAYIFNVSIENSTLRLIPDKWAKSEVDTNIEPREWKFKWLENSQIEKNEGLKEYCL